MKKNIPLIQGTILLLCVILAYFPTLKGLIGFLYTDGDYSYGLLVPLISAYVIFENRAKIRQAPVCAGWIAGIFLPVLAAISIYGIVG